MCVVHKQETGFPFFFFFSRAWSLSLGLEFMFVCLVLFEKESYVALTGLLFCVTCSIMELPVMLLSRPPECWDFRHMPPHPAPRQDFLRETRKG